MKTVNAINFAFLLIFASLLLFSGCAQQGFIEDARICECDKDFEFPQISQIAESFVVKGDCKIEIPDENIKESYGLRMFYEPVSSLYIQLDHLLLGKAIIAGGSDDEFWLWIRHNEVDSYWFGPWQQGCFDNAVSLALNPSVILEAMGLLYCQQDYQRYGCTCKAYVFNKIYPDGSEKKLWFDCCQQKLRKIELFGADGQALLVCTIKDYFEAEQGLQMPGLIEMEIFSQSKLAGKAVIEFKPDSFETKDFNDKFRKAYLTRPEPKGAEKVYQMLEDGSFLKLSAD